MNQSASSPRLTRGAHDPQAHAYNVVGLFSQILPLLSYIGRLLNDTMCDHADPEICDRCQKRLMTFGTLISGTASAVSSWAPAQLAELHARLAVAAARRLVDTIELGHPVAWAMKGGSVLVAARLAINTAAALLAGMADGSQTGDPGATSRAATACRELDLSTSRTARKRGLVAESYVIGHVLKAASKAAESAVVAANAAQTIAGSEQAARYEQTAEYAAGAAVGAALDAAALLDIDPGRAEAMMVVATGVVAEFDRAARPADACEKSTSQKVTPRVSCDCGQSPCAVYTVDAPISLGGPAEVHFRAEDAAALAAEDAAEDEVDARNRAAYAEANAEEHETAALPAWLESPTEEYDVLNDFQDTELGDVADEAIGDAAALAADLERAEAILNAITEEHRAVEKLVRTTREDGANAGMVTEYFQDCCVVCRDVKGRPIASPCRTMQIIQGFGQ